MNNKSKFLVEGLFWVVTLIVICLVMLPIYTTGIDFHFWKYNITFIVITLAFTRYIFFLKHMPFSHNTPIKVLFICITAPLLILLIDGLTMFQAYHDEVGLQELVKHLPMTDQNSMMKYMKTEYMFFGVSSIICALILPIRMIISLWRVRHKGTV